MCIRDRIQNHEFFKGIDWKNIRKHPAPFFSEEDSLTDRFDTSKFEKSYKKLDDHEKINPFVSNATPGHTSKGKSFDKRQLTFIRDFKELERLDLLLQKCKEDAEQIQKRREELSRKQTMMIIDSNPTDHLNDEFLPQSLFTTVIFPRRVSLHSSRVTLSL
eukprot:TRINITY_DN5084_c0_g2_i3.p1 TRINITY_DN5084_c0_g2~~TRINITY_DN5084_c0_g2_i3.p1  ORF type:complete len:183 (+),score=50.86 TRINITY_DN5084_c0_g2_i3:69-551(+)